MLLPRSPAQSIYVPNHHHTKISANRDCAQMFSCNNDESMNSG